MSNPVFDRVFVDNLIAGNTRISWVLSRHFTDPGPYVFDVFIGHADVPDMSNWTDLMTPLSDTYFAIDTHDEERGQTLDDYYRVQLVTPNGTYYSDPQNALGELSRRDWLFAREATRKELLRATVQTSVRGFLLKAIRYGPVCPVCLDQRTGEIGLSSCLTCYGTGFLNGYFAPLPAMYSDVGLEKSREHRDNQAGMIKPTVIQARFIGDPMLYSYDAWCAEGSDRRYYIHELSVLSQIRGIPLVYEAELRLAQFTDVLYKVPLTDPDPPVYRLENDKWQTKRPRMTYLEAALRSLKDQKTHS